MPQLVRSDGDDGSIEALGRIRSRDGSTARVLDDGAHPRTGAHFAAARQHGGSGGLGQHGTQRLSRDQEFAAARSTGQRDADDVRKYPRRCMRRRRVERCEAQRRPERCEHGRPGLREPRGDRLVRAIGRGEQAPEVAHRRPAIAQRQMLREQNRRRQMKRCRQGRRDIRRDAAGQAAEAAQRERQPLQDALACRNAMQPIDQRQRGAVRADQEVLAVVAGNAVDRDGAGASTQRRGLLVERHVDATIGEPHRRRAAGPAAADHRDARRWLCTRCVGTAPHAARAVFQAIQNLRSGVRAMRWSSTAYRSRSISSSSVW